MRIVECGNEMQSLALQWRREGRVIGLVPTMGWFHEGHLSLIRRARDECDRVVVSNFVNPTQFGPNEDFSGYPRDLRRDCRLAEQERTDVMFVPSVATMYPEGHVTYVDVRNVTNHLCGRSRPGHFRGVATIVAKLFHLCAPHRAYFGAKDYQQSVVIERMIEDLNFDVDLVRCPMIREHDGLAMSSRNAYLTPAEREAATALYRSLADAKGLIEGGARDAHWLQQQVQQALQAEPLARIDYVEVVDAYSLQPIDEIRGRILVAVAVWFGKARLIDNVVIEVGV